MDINYEQLAKELLSQSVSQKAVGSTPTATLGHGPGGLFSTPGMERPVFSAMVLPRVGLQSRLPIRPTNVTDPLFPIVTGVTATSGSEPEGVCDDPPIVGLTKLCMHSFTLGRFSRMTKIYDIDSIGRITNRGEFLDLRMMNNPLKWAGDNPNAPTAPGANGVENIARNELAKALFEFGVAWSRDFAKKIYDGNPSNNTAGGGYKEFYGLEYLVNTGYQDAETGQLCPAADSIVRDFGNKLVASNAADLIRQLTNMYRNTKYLATQAGLDPVKFAFTMPWSLFYEITEIWPISYMTYRAMALPDGSHNIVDAFDIEQMREQMRGDLYNHTGQYLLIDGQKVEVILDTSQPETENGDGTFTSDIYLLPMTVLGGTPSLYLEYFNYDAPGATMEFARYLAPEDSYYTTDNGRFLWHKKPPTNFCVQALAKTEPRLMLLTPYIAGRLTNVNYMPLMHERSPFTDSGYFVDGGNTEYSAPSYYTPIQTQQ